MNPMNESGHDDRTTEPGTDERIDVKSNDVTPGTERATQRPGQRSRPSQPSPSGRVSESEAAHGPVTPDRTADPHESSDPREPAEQARRVPTAEPEHPVRAPHTPREPGAPKATAEDADKLQRRLQQAVGGFVDEPRHAVEEADHVLEEATERLVQELKGRRHALRAGWDGGRDETDTEKLRVALQGYRELVDRVLHV